ncbi:MAG: hypothetical protein WC312_05265 [Candidatus Omnitrophota bacterium]|jgi:hypothetical protein
MAQNEMQVWVTDGFFPMVKGNLAEAVKSYQEKNGGPPRLIFLSPSNMRFAGEAGEDIDVRQHNGLCAWEAWLGESFQIPRSDAAPVPVKPAETTLNTKPATVQPTQPDTDRELSFIPSLNQSIIDILKNSDIPAKEKSSRAIARTLNSRGFKTNHMTVYRRVKEVTNE